MLVQTVFTYSSGETVPPVDPVSPVVDVAPVVAVVPVVPLSPLSLSSPPPHAARTSASNSVPATSFQRFFTEVSFCRFRSPVDGRPTGRSREDSRELPPATGLAEHLTLVLALRDRVALLERALPAPERELHLHHPVREIDAQGDERESTLGGLADQSLDLLAVKKQLARSDRVVRPLVHRLLVGRDVHPLEPHLVPADARIRLGQRTTTATERLHLGPREDDPGLEPLEDLVVVTRLAVRDDRALAGGIGLARAHERSLDVEEPAHPGERREHGDDDAGDDQPRDHGDDVAVVDPWDELDLRVERVDERDLQREQEQDRDTSADQALEDALDEERCSDAPVRRADELHDPDLLAAGEQPHPNGVRDQ